MLGRLLEWKGEVTNTHEVSVSMKSKGQKIPQKGTISLWGLIALKLRKLLPKKQPFIFIKTFVEVKIQQKVFIQTFQSVVISPPCNLEIRK